MLIAPNKRAILGAMRPLLLTMSAVAVCATGAWAEHAPRQVEDLTRDMRFSPPFLSFAEAPSDPKVIYMGDLWGRGFVTRDRG